MKRLLAITLFVAACSAGGSAATVVSSSAVVSPTPLDVVSLEPSPTPTPEPSPTPTPDLEPVIVKGTNDGNTKRFELGPGDYEVMISGKSTSDFGGNVIVRIYDVDGRSETLSNEIVDARGPYEYTTYQYGYAGGLYYLDVTMPAGMWSVSFTPV